MLARDRQPQQATGPPQCAQRSVFSPEASIGYAWMLPDSDESTT